MIQVRFTTFELSPGNSEWVELPVAELVADGDDLEIRGPHPEWISPDIAIVDPGSGERVTRADDLERWAQLLPLAYRNGDIVVEVVGLPSAEPAGAAFHRSGGR